MGKKKIFTSDAWENFIAGIAALKDKIDGKADEHTHPYLSSSTKYAGSSTAGGSATSAVKLDTASAGSATNPVYFADGKPVKTTYTLGASVPSDAKFTDTVYTLPVATSSALGGVKSGGDVTISSTGAITVNDDSHNHTISNVDNLQSELDSINTEIDGSIKALSVSGKIITYTKNDGTTGTITTQDTVYTHPTSSGNKHIPSGGSSGQFLKWSADGTAVWAADNNTTYGVVSTTADGLAPKRDGSTTKYLRADGTWATLPAASGTQAGIAVVYPAASCTTFSSDSGTVTPLAVQKGAKQFAITRPSSSTNKAITRYSNTTGDVQDSKIIIEDVTNTRDSSKTAQVIAIPAEGNKKMVYGYCTDQVDGTSFIGGVFDASDTSYPYASGLAIGGTSGNLLWKGNKVIDASNISEYANKYTLPNATSSTLGGVKVGSNITVSSGTISLTKANVTAALGYTPPTSDTNTTYSAGTGISLSGTTFSNSGVRSITTGSSNGTISVNTNGTSADVAVKGLAAAAYKAVTDSTSASAISTGTSLVTERDVYYGLPKINNSNSYTRSTTIYAPTAGGTSGYVLVGAGTTTAPTWSSLNDAGIMDLTSAQSATGIKTFIDGIEIGDEGVQLTYDSTEGALRITFLSETTETTE